MDNLTKEQRKKTMQSIRSKNTKAELILAKELRRLKIHYRRYLSRLPGKPDFTLFEFKTVIFVDSDFWHFNPKRFIEPKSNIEYWKNKINNNRIRDKKVNAMLKNLDWKVIRVWEYDLKHNLGKQLNKIIKFLKKE